MPAVAQPTAAPASAAPAAPTPSPDSLTIPAPSSPPKTGSARERMQKETGTKWGEDPPAVPKGTEVPASDPPKPGKGGETPAARPGEEPSAEPAAPPADLSPEQKKQNPWKLYRAEKERAATLERQIAEAKAASLAETEKAQYLDRIEKAEAKLKTYEDEIRFKSYEKSEEFQSKYETPYNQAWQRHMEDLRGVTITGEDGTVRPMEAKDILDLVNLELPDARELADAKWGKFSGDAMAARKEIRSLFETRARALEEARKTGAEREKQVTERNQKYQRETNAHIKTTWDSANQAALADPNNGEYFKPAEGDETRNQLLGKGFALVDKAFSENPMDARLTPEQRAEVVKRHAAVRNRAAAFGPMKYIIRKLQQQIKDLEKANGQFKESQPSTAGGVQAPGSVQPTSGKAKLEAARAKWG